MPRQGYQPQQEIYGGGAPVRLPMLGGGGLSDFRSRGERDCPEGYTWDGIERRCVPKPRAYARQHEVGVNRHAERNLERFGSGAYVRDPNVKGGLTPVGYSRPGTYDPDAGARAGQPYGVRMGVGGGVGGGGPSYEERQLSMKLEKARLALEQEVARGGMSLAEANQRLQRYMADEQFRLEEKMGMEKLGLEEKLGTGKLDIERGYLEETEATRRAQEAWRQQLLDEMLGMMDGGAGGGSDAINWEALEERMYMPAQRNITGQMREGLATMGGQAAGAGYGGRSSWEDKQRGGILTGGARAIGDVRSAAGVQTTRAKLEERARQRQERITRAGLLASMGG